MRLRFQKADIAAIAAVVVLAILVFLCFLPGSRANAGYAEIYMDGKLVRTVSLDTPQEFTLTGSYTNTVTVQDGKIAVTASTCPGEDCVGCGWVSTSGRSIVCLPNGIEIRIISQSDGVDLVVG